MVQQITLTKGCVALVDDEDYERIAQHHWQVASRPGRATQYAARIASGVKIYMHREILRPTPPNQTDHVNRNGLDNRRINLREATVFQNQANRVLPTSKTGYRGVSVTGRPTRLRFRVEINAKGKRQCLGCFETAEAAALAYDELAIRLHGAFAILNFPSRASAA